MNGLHHQVLVESNLIWLALILIMDNTCLQIHKVALCWLIILLKPFSFLVSQRKKRKRKKGEPWNLHFVSFCFPPCFFIFSQLSSFSRLLLSLSCRTTFNHFHPWLWKIPRSHDWGQDKHDLYFSSDYAELITFIS